MLSVFKKSIFAIFVLFLGICISPYVSYASYTGSNEELPMHSSEKFIVVLDKDSIKSLTIATIKENILIYTESYMILDYSIDYSEKHDLTQAMLNNAKSDMYLSCVIKEGINIDNVVEKCKSYSYVKNSYRVDLYYNDNASTPVTDPSVPSVEDATDSTKEDEAPVVTSPKNKLVVNVKKVTMKKGKKIRIKVTANQKVTFKSSNKKIATVSKKGLVHAKKKGSVKITIRSGALKKVVKVKVK